MTLVNTTSPVTFSEGQKLKLGRKTYTVADAISHAVALEEAKALALLDAYTKMLPWVKEQGDIFIQIRAMFPEGKSGGTEFKNYIRKSELYGTDLVKVTKDKDGKTKENWSEMYDAITVASNWTLVQKLNKNGELDDLKPSAIRKRIDAETKPKAEPKAQKSAGNVSKGKKAGKSIPNGIAVSEAELAKFVNAEIEANGLDLKKFVNELAALRQKRQKG